MLSNWEKIANKIGPLRYQMSESDCAPTSVINSLLFLKQQPLHPILLKTIYGVSMFGSGGPKSGSGWVSCKLLSDVVNSWCELGFYDNFHKKQEKRVSSSILRAGEVNLRKNGKIMKCLNGRGGAVCLSVDQGAHYISILGIEDEKFLVFDPSYWSKRVKLSKGATGTYFGLINCVITPDELKVMAGDDTNSWAQILEYDTTAREE
jgi:hypothetical protein